MRFGTWVAIKNMDMDTPESVDKVSPEGTSHMYVHLPVETNKIQIEYNQNFADITRKYMQCDMRVDDWMVDNAVQNIWAKLCVHMVGVVLKRIFRKNIVLLNKHNAKKNKELFATIYKISALNIEFMRTVYDGQNQLLKMAMGGNTVIEDF